MRKISLLSLLFVSCTTFSQTYQPTWESIDARPVPQWFKDAKFGIFIHWGVYAVPGWSTKGNYAEWYQFGLQTSDTARQKFHKAKFGTRTYYDLANDFKAELYNPDEWANLFERSGAKYIVLTSKHHDGYTLWPNKKANETWGFPWNSVEVGPQRDLLGDLFKSVRKTSVRAGMYFSLYEWFNPLWKSDKIKYATDHAWPQMKELIYNYQPDVFWTDGDWEAGDDVWKSKEFLAWLYNESPVKDKVVTNDRWGSGIRFKHGGIFTPEYQPDLDFEDHYWEESRGMGYSYGYNREEDAWDYNSAQSLILQLIDKVSRGGNFLLDIGPDEHGKIPPIMQERLLQMGEWLKINGEAIYGTSRWKQHSQWSEGRRDYKDRSGDMLLKITVEPDPGYAVKELFFTYNDATNSLYAIFPKYPGNRKLMIKNQEMPQGTAIQFLSTNESLSWKQNGENVEINLPEYSPDRMKAPYAYAIKIADYGKFIPKPKIAVEYPGNGLDPLISISSQMGTIYYTTDGTNPAIGSSVRYSNPFSLKNTGTVKAFVIYSKGPVPPGIPITSAMAELEVIKYEWMDAARLKKVSPGISYSYYEPSGRIDMKAISGPAIKSGVIHNISVSGKQRRDKFGFVFEGYIKIEKDGVYDFFTQSDDGSKLYIDEKEIVNNDGDHGNQEKEGRAALKKGYHRLKVVYFDSGGDNSLKVLIQPAGGKKEEIPSSILYH